MLSFVSQQTPQTKKTNSIFVEESQFSISLSKVMQSKHLENLHIQLTHLPSLSSADFVRILEKILASAINGNCKLVSKQILNLMRISHDYKQVVRLMQKSQLIDPIMVLVLLWNQKQHVQKLQQIIQCLNLLLDSFPIALIVTAKPYLRKWFRWISQKDVCLAQKSKMMRKLICQAQKDMRKISNQDKGAIIINM